MNCRYGPVIRKSKFNRKNRGRDTVQIPEIPISTVRIVAGYGSDIRNSDFNRKNRGRDTVQIPENSKSTVRIREKIRFRY